MIVNLINFLSLWVIPVFIALVLVTALIRRVNVFDVFVEGAKDGFNMSVRLIPFLVGMLVAIGLFRDSGVMDLAIKLITPVLMQLNIPAEIIPLAIMRPISGSAALALTTDILQRSGPDSLLGRMASTMQGSTDTTLYILTVYFGAVGIYRTRHALTTGLLADLGGFIASIVVCKAVFG
ncbi:MAG: nucleoside recognition domain-containing protein [Bacillota bacterium]